MSLRSRLALAFALGAAVLTAVAGLAFAAQLSASLNSALDGELRMRSDALAAQLASPRWLAGGVLGAAQAGNQNGQWSGAEPIAEVLSAAGSVRYPASAAGSLGPLLNRTQLRDLSAGPFTSTTVIEGERFRILATRVRWQGRSGVAVVGVPTAVADAALARARLVTLIGGPIAILVAGLGAWLLTGAALRPVDQLRRRLEETSEHDPGARLAVPSTGDELASLAVTMNGLLERLHQVLTRQRGFVADAGHELRTPLTALKAELQLAARPGKSKAALIAGVTAAAGDTDRLIRLAEDLLLLARADDAATFLNPRPVDIDGLVSNAARGFASRAEARGVNISVRDGENVTAVADPDRLRQAIDNLLDNAVQHAPVASVVEVTSHITDTTIGGQRVAVIAVRDHGHGFPSDFLPHALERFRRADQARGRAEGGSGLGLAIVASIASAHGGRAIACNHPGGGAVVRIEFPVAPSTP